MKTNFHEYFKLFRIFWPSVTFLDFPPKLARTPGKPGIVIFLCDNQKHFCHILNSFLAVSSKCQAAYVLENWAIAGLVDHDQSVFRIHQFEKGPTETLLRRLLTIQKRTGNSRTFLYQIEKPTWRQIFRGLHPFLERYWHQLAKGRNSGKLQNDIYFFGQGYLFLHCSKVYFLSENSTLGFFLIF